jgi:hypothetical protein
MDPPEGHPGQGAYTFVIRMDVPTYHPYVSTFAVYYCCRFSVAF